jgi:hypothetical protein
MKIEFTIHSMIPLVFIAKVDTNADAWRLLDILSRQPFPITHRQVTCET